MATPTHLQQVIEAVGPLHAVAGQLPGSIQRQHGVESHYVHAQSEGRLDHVAADGSEANDA